MGTSYRAAKASVYSTVQYEEACRISHYNHIWGSLRIMQRKWNSSSSVWGKRANLCGYQIGSSVKQWQAVIGNTLSPFLSFFFGSEHLLSVPEQSLADSIFSLEEASVKVLTARTHYRLSYWEAIDIWWKMCECSVRAAVVGIFSLAPSLFPTWSTVVGRSLFNINLHFFFLSWSKTHMNFKAFSTS